VTPAERKRLHYVADLLALAATYLRELADEEEGPVEPLRRGRPRIEPTPFQVAEVIRLRNSNGRPGYRVIGDAVGLSWLIVGRILTEHEASQKDASASQKPSAGKGGGAD
jgi:hypothetical protein